MRAIPRTHRHVAGVLIVALAGCAAPSSVEVVSDPRVVAAAAGDDSAAVAEWEQLPWKEQCDLLRSALHSRERRVALFAAKMLPPTCLSLEEIHQQMDLLVGRPEEEVFDFGCEGAYAIGSPDVARALGNAIKSGLLPSGEWAATDLHRAMIPEQIPTLVSLLDVAKGEAFGKVWWFLTNLARNSNANRAQVARAILFALECCRADLDGRPPPRLETIPIPDVDGPGVPSAFQVIAAIWAGQSRDPAAEYFGNRLKVPGPWLERWALDLRDSGVTDPLLDAVLEDPGGSLAGEETGFAPPEDPAAYRSAASALAPGELLPPRIVAFGPDEGGTVEIDGRGVMDLHPLVALARLGDTELLPRMLNEWPGTFQEAAWTLGRVRDPRVRPFLVEKSRESNPANALQALAVHDGLPEELAGVFEPAGDEKRDWSQEPWRGARELVVAGDPAAAVVALAEGGRLQETAFARLGLLRHPEVPRLLELARNERWRGLYWPATAGLAIHGDQEARREFLAFLAEDRVWIRDDLDDPVLLTLNGDQDAIEMWLSRISTNCCLSFQAGCALQGVYPTLPWTHGAVQFVDEEKRMRAWISDHRFVRSRLVDGLVPERDR